MKILHIAICAYLCTSCGGGMRVSHPAVDAGWTSDGTKAAESEAPDGADSGNRTDSQVCLLSGGGVVHVPQEHRAVSETCPAERGSIGPVDTTQCTNTSEILCRSDADCTAGRNGRCLVGDWCMSSCSYDQCLADADCPGIQPCLCRRSGVDTLANECLPGSNCRTDADCGDCGFCSRSAQHSTLQCLSVDGCAEAGCDGGGTTTSCTCTDVVSLAYVCHTLSDECTNDRDCPLDYCAYMDEATHWKCGVCTFPNFM